MAVLLLIASGVAAVYLGDNNSSALSDTTIGPRPS
jgi:hypothetical protein